MNLISFELFEKAKKELILRRPMYYSTIFAGLLFLLLLFSGQVGAAFGVGIGVFLFLFLLTYGLLSLQTKTVLKKTQHFAEDVPHINVTHFVNGTFAKEEGILCFYDDHIVYKGLIKGAANKEFTIEINEDLFISYGELKRKRMDKFKEGDYQKCHITVRPMPRGIPRQFLFYNIDNALDKVGHRLEEISRFNPQKYQ
jgi:hypothetical protein